MKPELCSAQGIMGLSEIQNRCKDVVYRLICCIETVLCCVDEVLCADTVAIMKCVKLIDSCLTDESVFCFEQDAYHSQNMTDVCTQLISSIIDR